MSTSLPFVLLPEFSHARRNLPQALHHRSVPPKPPSFFVIVGRAGCPVFAASARSHRFESEKCRAHPSASIPSWRRAKTQSCSVARRQCQSDAFAQPKSASQFQASAAMRIAIPALVCFAIQMKTQIQSTAVAHRAWPNPSFKRTRLRRSA